MAGKCWENAFAVSGASVPGTYAGTPQDPVRLELTPPSQRRQRCKAERAQCSISVVTDLCGLSFAAFFSLYY